MKLGTVPNLLQLVLKLAMSMVSEELLKYLFLISENQVLLLYLVDNHSGTSTTYDVFFLELNGHDQLILTVIIGISIKEIS